MRNFIKRHQSGVAALEASLTLPVVMILIFFILEFLRVNNTKTAMDSMALEATLEFVSAKNISNFETIIEKHRPRGVPTSSIRYYFTMYESLESMCSTSPYGNEEVFWPDSDQGAYSSPSIYIDSNRDQSFAARNSGSGYIVLTDQTDPLTTPSINSAQKISGKAFVLTFVCNFKFSSPFVKKLFAGGSNTKSVSGNGNKFLIWGRGVGICD